MSLSLSPTSIESFYLKYSLSVDGLTTLRVPLHKNYQFSLTRVVIVVVVVVVSVAVVVVAVVVVVAGVSKSS